MQFKQNSTVPTQITMELRKNGTLVPNAQVTTDSTVVTLRTQLQVMDILKLDANDYIEVFVTFATNDGYVDDDNTEFYGAQIA